MLQIAICDDIAAELARIARLTYEFLSERGIDACVRRFAHPDALVTACEKEAFHIYLLDMVMPMMSGLEIGRSIRRADTDAQIIFITTEPDFALDAYSVNPLHYLVKPVSRDALFSALTLAARKVNFGEDICIMIKTREGVRTLSADDILYCEYARHAVLYTLQCGERVQTSVVTESFAEHVSRLLRDKRFIQPHAAFAVNMRYVERLDKTGFTMRDGARIPISGRRFAAVRDAYMRYRLGEK
jgi:two-component system LytT family response regulator